MSKDENKCDNTQSITISKNTPEVKILNRGDLLGAINCLFPELQLKDSHLKLKENFSLFSHSPQELTKIFESGRKYRTRIAKNLKSSLASHSFYSLRTDSNRINFKRNTNTLGNSSTKNMVSASTTRKSRAQTKQNINEENPSKRSEIVQFSSSYTDALTKVLEPNFHDRFLDFKNIECIIQELNYLYKGISKEHKIGPFNPNLPVLNISKCDQIVRSSSGSKEILKMKSSTSIKHIRNKKSSSRLAKTTLKIQNEVKGKEGKPKGQVKQRRRKSQVISQMNVNQSCLTDDSDDENGKRIAKDIETLLSDDTFSPRYNAKHMPDMFTIFQKSFSETNLSTSYADQLELEKAAMEQYEIEDDYVDMNFNLQEY